MNKFLKIAVLVGILGFLSAHSAPPFQVSSFKFQADTAHAAVSYDYDADFDISSYQTAAEPYLANLQNIQNASSQSISYYQRILRNLENLQNMLTKLVDLMASKFSSDEDDNTDTEEDGTWQETDDQTEDDDRDNKYIDLEKEYPELFGGQSNRNLNGSFPLNFDYNTNSNLNNSNNNYPILEQPYQQPQQNSNQQGSGQQGGGSGQQGQGSGGGQQGSGGGGGKEGGEGGKKNEGKPTTKPPGEDAQSLVDKRCPKCPQTEKGRPAPTVLKSCMSSCEPLCIQMMNDPSKCIDICCRECCNEKSPHNQ